MNTPVVLIAGLEISMAGDSALVHPCFQQREEQSGGMGEVCSSTDSMITHLPSHTKDISHAEILFQRDFSVYTQPPTRASPACRL